MKGDSFSERTARERARVLLDQGTFRELLGPFARLESPHLPPQGIVPQSDDGVVVARGRIRANEAVVVSVEGGFQGGSIGEVGGAKIAGALDTPEIDVTLLPVWDGVNNTHSVGIGEPATVATAGAIANAVSHAIGTRITSLPITPESILAALDAKARRAGSYSAAPEGGLA